MKVTVFTKAAILGLGIAVASTANAADRATKKAEVVTLDSGIVLVDKSRAVVLESITPVGKKQPVAASKKEMIDIGIYTSDELMPKALVGVTDKENTTSIDMTRDGVLDVGTPVDAVEGEVETVVETNIIYLKPEKDEEAHAFGGTVKNGDLYYAQNGEVYQYTGALK